MAVRLIEGDMLAELPKLAAAGEQFSAVVTDPPYHLTTGKKGGTGAASLNVNSPAGRARISTGFMGKVWDGGDIAFQAETWRLCWELLPPGGHLLAFSGTRTFHRMACAIEDAGFEIRDTIAWLYGSGFPKSLDVAKSIDKAQGVSGTYGAPKSAAHAGWIERGAMRGDSGHEGYQRPWMQDSHAVDRAARQYEPGSEEAAKWLGYGTALKPAMELICLARKPLADTVATNVQMHGAGAINIDACRIATDWAAERGESWLRSGRGTAFANSSRQGPPLPKGSIVADRINDAGRWPANVVHDGSDEVVGAFPETQSGTGAVRREKSVGYQGPSLGKDSRPAGTAMVSHPDSLTGSAARFFYSAKADADDRLGSKHPTVKPVDLIRWLVRLVTPKGGRVLDPFAGSGTTGAACMAEGFDRTMIEREAEYAADIRRRIAHVTGEDTPLFAR